MMNYRISGEIQGEEEYKQLAGQYLTECAKEGRDLPEKAETVLLRMQQLTSSDLGPAYWKHASAFIDSKQSLGALVLFTANYLQNPDRYEEPQPSQSGKRELSPCLAACVKSVEVYTSAAKKAKKHLYGFCEQQLFRMRASVDTRMLGPEYWERMAALLENPENQAIYVSAKMLSETLEAVKQQEADLRQRARLKHAQHQSMDVYRPTKR